MKQRTFTLIAATAALILSACGGGNAQAQDLYRVSQNASIGTQEVLKVAKSNTGYLDITTVTGQVFQSVAYDPSNVIINKIAVDNPKWLLIGNTLYAMTRAVTATCTNQGSAIYWPYSTIPEIVNDGCQIAYQNAANGKTTYSY